MEFWKICRVLKNPIRLALLREIAESPRRAQNVLQAGEHVGQKKSVTSQYLKKLVETRLLSVERTGPYTICTSGHQIQSPVARLQLALASHFAKDPVGKNDADILKLANALAHHGRIRILRLVAEHSGIRFAELAEKADFPFTTLRRQLGVLIDAGIIAPNEGKDGLRTYSLARQHVPLFRTMVSLALDIRLVQ